MINSNANDMLYDNEKTSADFISDALQIYTNKLSISPIPDSPTLNLAYNAITTALSYGVVIKQQDLRKIIIDTNVRLQNCESENTRLKSDNESLIQQLRDLNTIKNDIEKQLVNISPLIVMLIE